MRKRISEIGEDGLIDIIFEIIGETHSDDAISEPLPCDGPSFSIVSNTDMLVSTTDIPAEMTAYLAGKKAVVMAVSDLLVKGVKPVWATVALGLPNEMRLEGENGFKALIQGLHDGFKEYGTKYRGGDINQTRELIISISVNGYIPTEKIIHRYGAHPGDVVFINGEFGYTGIGFASLLDKIPTENINHDIIKKGEDAVLRSVTSMVEGPFLSEYHFATASCDSSDGFHRSIGAIARASKVGFEIDFDRMVNSEILEFEKLTGISAEKLVLGAGEEWIHIFCISENKAKELRNVIKKEEFNETIKGHVPALYLIEIGKCTGASGQIKYIRGNKEIFPKDNIKGYTHFH